MTQWLLRIGAAVCVLGLLGATSNPQDQLSALADVDAQRAMSFVAPELGSSDATDILQPPEMLVSMEFENVQLGDILKAFSQQTGINVIASGEVGDQTITLYLEDVMVMDALDQILEVSDLIYERPAGSQIYLVKPRPEEEEVITVTKVYRLKFARVSTSRLARAAEALAAFVPQGSGAAVGGAVGSVGLAGEDVGVDQILQGILTDVGEVEVDGRTNSLIVTDIEENFPRIEYVLNTLDIKTAQIVIESEVLETTLTKLKDLGLEWGTGPEGDFVDFTLGSRSTRFPWGPFGRISPELSIADRKFTATTINASDTLGILQALEQDTETKILARPRILTLDNERAIIQLTTDQAVGFTTTTGQQTATTSVEPERTTTGIILVVTPQINEGGFVTMLVEPSVTATVTSSVTPPTGSGTVVDPRTRTARVLVRIPDGDTLVIGGLIDRTESEVIRRVPVLSSIPFIGELFTNTEINDDVTELVVFVTPHIVQEPSGPQVAAVDEGFPFPRRIEEEVPSRQELIEWTLERLEEPPR